MLHRPIFVAGATAALLAVALGAFAAHGLRARLDPALLAAFRTGVDYQMYHALALLALAGPAAEAVRGIWFRRAAGCFLGGMLLFSGSLYALALLETRGIGMITPLGGLLFMVGWICAITGGLRRGD